MPPPFDQEWAYNNVTHQMHNPLKKVCLQRSTESDKLEVDACNPTPLQRFYLMSTEEVKKQVKLG